MCGRIANTLPNDAMAQLFSARPSNTLPEVPNFNICPTNGVHVVRSGAGGRKLDPLRWGFVPHWYKSPTDGPLLINARAETLAEKPAFRAACRERRCLILATGFYEWTGTKDGKRLPWYIHRRDQEPIAFAGVWQDWGRDDARQSTCAIVTTAANTHLGAIHHRMPLILEPENWSLWLGEKGKGAARLMQPGAEEVLDYYRVRVEVNSNRANGAELIEPFDAE
ncbi:SOS response-associated peptidase [Ruegeria sp. HKCCD7255]|uniref:SOS response-associated peptidase n=1 Tax=Ruegeria sp. HKCCD7255 TaxID=2683004 RepID=UPI0014893BA1|nr:SOS response-associated peptidase [Ruegeria sp. HKCCD7255]